MMAVRQFKESEWQAYKAIRLEALSLHEGVFGSSYADEAAFPDARWRETLARKDQAFFALCVDGHVVGCGGVVTDSGDPTGRTAILVGGYIREDQRGKGLSRALYEARLGWIRESGRFDWAATGHREGNTISRAANRAYGFEPTGRVERSWGDGTRGYLETYRLAL